MRVRASHRPRAGFVHDAVAVDRNGALRVTGDCQGTVDFGDGVQHASNTGTPDMFVIELAP